MNVANTVNIFIAFFGYLSATLLFAKFLQPTSRKNYTILGASVIRFLLAVTASFYISQATRHPEFHLAMLAVLVVDCVSNITYFLSKKYTREIEGKAYLITINRLLGKVAAIIDNPYIGYFTTDEDGIIEFANSKLESMLNEPELEGKSLYTFLDWETVDKIKNRNMHSCEGMAKPANMEPFRIKITSARTINGHITITGSVIEYSQTC